MEVGLRNSLVTGSAVLLVLGLACGGFPDIPYQDDRPDWLLDDDPATTAPPMDPMDVYYAPLRSGPTTVDGVPGWMGLATSTKGFGENWTFQTDKAQVVMPWPEPFLDVPQGLEFVGTTPAGDVELVFQGLETLPFGCDGGTLEVAMFSGPSLPEGPVWITAPRTDVDASGFTTGPRDTDSVAYTGPGGSWTLELDKTQFELTGPGGRFVAPRPPVEDYGIVLDLNEDDTLGAPFPAMAAEVERHALTILRQYSFEGVNVVYLDHQMKEVGRNYLYVCAF